MASASQPIRLRTWGWGLPRLRITRKSAFWITKKLASRIHTCWNPLQIANCFWFRILDPISGYLIAYASGATSWQFRDNVWVTGLPIEVPAASPGHSWSRDLVGMSREKVPFEESPSHNFSKGRWPREFSFWRNSADHTVTVQNFEASRAQG